MDHSTGVHDAAVGQEEWKCKDGSHPEEMALPNEKLPSAEALGGA